MPDTQPVAAPAVPPQPPAWPELPTAVGLPGATIELEVGGQVCLGHGDGWPL